MRTARPIPASPRHLSRAPGDPAVVCGSLYLTGAAIAALAPECDELAWFRQFVPDANETR